MRWMQRWLLLASATAGCPSFDNVAADVPDDVVVAGLVRVDANGAVTGGSALTPWGRNLSAFTPSDGTTFVLGYTDAQLAPYENVVDPSKRLEAATGCQNRLPTPAYAAQLTADGLTPVDPTMAPAVTLPVVETTCPSIESVNLAFDVTCHDERCRPVARSVDECTTSFDLSACGLGALSVTINAMSEVCAAMSGCAPVQDEHSESSLRCALQEASPCAVHVYSSPREREAPFTFVRKAWREVEPDIPIELTERAWLGARFVRAGYGYGMTMLDDLIVVTGPETPAPAERCGLVPFFVHLIDPMTLEPVLTKPTESCAEALSADPGGQTYVTTYVDGQTWQLGRFDRQGDLVSHVPIMDPTVLGFDASGPQFRTQEILRPPGVNELWVVMYNDGGNTQPPGISVSRYDATTLAYLSQTTLADTWLRGFSGFATSSTEYTQVSETGSAVGWFRIGASVPVTSVEVVFRDAVVNNVLYTITPAPNDRVLIAARAKSPAVIVDRTGRVQTLVHPAGEVEQWIMRYGPWQDNLTMAFGMQTINQGRREAIATLLDVDGDRFLPGVWEIGEGLPTYVETDADGRLFVMLPWTAELVRIDPLVSR